MDVSDLDFSAFLDIGDIANLDVSDFADLGDHGSDAQSLGAGPAALDFGADHFDLPTGLEAHEFGDAGAASQAWSQQRQRQQQQQQQQQQQNTYRPPNHVPPTPNSYELQGSAGRFVQSHMLDQQYQPNKNGAAAFGPLVSPAVTPQDSQFQTIPEYTVPGAYFSPLTSPALQAQQQQQSHHFNHGSHYTNPTTASSSLAASPLDIDMDMDSLQHESAPLSEPARRTRRKAQGPHSAAPAARVRQSPIVKAQSKRRTSNLSSVIPSHEISNLLLEAQALSSSLAQPLSAGLANNGLFDNSCADSVSPEALPDAVMGPPPRPGSAWHSPALQAQSHSAPASATVKAVQGPGGAPATPASLMSLNKTPQFDANGHGPMAPPGSGRFQSQDQTAVLEDFALPPAAASRQSSKDKNGPTVSAGATPRLAPAGKSTPKLAPSRGRNVSSLSTTSSPVIGANQSPTAPGKKADARSKRGSGSVSVSGLVSPAIRPKISPSIKPLLPEGANLSESQQALLLASKSNYTHLLEGTRLPGVSYPESLSLGLTSKRTSHKLAEQGRRNRMNDALKEMQTLLPKPRPKGGKAGDEAAAAAAALAAQDEEDEKNEAKGAGSKAATVESAIDYIRVLQQDKAIAAQLLKQKDDELAKLRDALAKAGLKCATQDKNGSGNVDADVDMEKEKSEQGVETS